MRVRSAYNSDLTPPRTLHPIDELECLSPLAVLRRQLGGLLLLLGALTQLNGCHHPSDATPENAPPEELPSYEGGELGGKEDGVVHNERAWAALPDWQQPVRLETLFAPDDPTVSLELHLIDQVIEAKKKAQNDEGIYRIRYAVYNLTSTTISSRLIAAHRAGVDVQVLIEDDQLSPDRPWLDLDERFIEAGLRVEPRSHRVKEEELNHVHLLGVSGHGLMHLKLRLYETPSSKALLTGSYNPNTTSSLNEESLHYSEDPSLIDRYSRAYYSLLYDYPIYNEWDEEAPVNVLFTPSSDYRAVDQIFRWIEEEKDQILLMMFSLRDLTAPSSSETLVELLGRKVREGVNVSVITDRKQSDGFNGYGEAVYDDDQTDDKLRAVGIPVYEVINPATPFTAMHHKVAILGRERLRVISGAGNWTRSGLGSFDRPARNVESILFIDSDRLDQNYTGDRYLGQWIRVLRRYGHQSVDRHEESAVEPFISSLINHPNWPEASVRFEVRDLVTYGGEEVGIGGSIPALGSWSTQLLQWLDQDEHVPHSWKLEHVWIPVGARVEWKVALRDEMGVTKWEDGYNRSADLHLPLSRDHQPTWMGQGR